MLVVGSYGSLPYIPVRFTAPLGILMRAGIADGAPFRDRTQCLEAAITDKNCHFERSYVALALNEKSLATSPATKLPLANGGRGKRVSSTAGPGLPAIAGRGDVGQAVYSRSVRPLRI
jgi:hypothetical protein